MTGRQKRKKKKNSSLQLLVVFIAIAVATILILEYIDFKKGKESFVFSKIIPLGKAEKQGRQFNKRLGSILKVNKIPYDYFRDKEGKFHFKVDIDEARFDGLLSKIKGVASQFKGQVELSEIQGMAEKSIMLYKVKIENNVSHLLLISKHKPIIAEKKKKASPQEDPEEKEKPAPPSKPRIAFIIDDMGAYEIGALELKKLKIPITASVLPDSRRSREVVHWLNQYGLKAMIHLPMQPTNSNGKKYNTREVITVNSTDDQIRALVQRARQKVPIARGVNNHQGSLVTSRRGIMSRVLKIIKEEGLFFIDSRTIGGTVAYSMAKEMGIPTTHKDVFIDHVQNYSHSLAQIRRLVEVALQKGKAVAIGHPFNSTLRAIKDSKRYIHSKGVEIVFAEELLE